MSETKARVLEPLNTPAPSPPAASPGPQSFLQKDHGSLLFVRWVCTSDVRRMKDLDEFL
jgi:hypothetical protein